MTLHCSERSFSVGSVAPADRRRSLPGRLAEYVRANALLPAVLLVAVATLFRAQGTVDSDVAWQLWIARHLQSGAVLYRDIVETNPPLWFWMGVPVDWVARHLLVRPESALMAALAGLTMLSASVLNRLINDVAPGRRCFLVTAAAAAMLLIPWTDAGQREQIVLIGAIPYAALIAARRNNHPVPLWLAALIGAAGGLCFALKHYFLIVPALLELWLLANLTRRWRPLRAETLGMVAVGAAYAVAMIIFAPAFFTKILPMLRLAYGATGAPAIRYLFQPALVAALLTLAVVVAQARSLLSPKMAFAAAMFITSLGFAAAYFIQFKGWPYHAIPVVGSALLCLAAFVTGSSPNWLKLAAPALLALPFGISLDTSLRAASYSNHELELAVSGLRPGDGVGFIAEDSAAAWSVTLQHRLRYASRYNGFWMLRAVAANELKQRPDPRLAALGRSVVEQTIVDFRCIGPKRIIFVHLANRSADSLDLPAFFRRDPQFAQLMSHYRRINPPSPVEVYELSTPLPHNDQDHCRSGV